MNRIIGDATNWPCLPISRPFVDDERGKQIFWLHRSTGGVGRKTTWPVGGATGGVCWPLGGASSAAPLSQLRRIYVFLFELRGFSAGFFWRATYIYDYYILPSRQNLYLFIWYLSGEKTHGALQQNNQIQQILSLVFFFFFLLSPTKSYYVTSQRGAHSKFTMLQHLIGFLFSFKKKIVVLNNFNLILKKEYFWCVKEVRA